MRVPLSAHEHELHLRELDRLRKWLFRRRTPDQCWIVGETVIPPHVETMRHLHNNQSYRVLSKGGLEFELKFPIYHGPRWVSVQSWAGDNYLLYASWGRMDIPARYGRLSTTINWSYLEQRFLEIIAQMKNDDELFSEIKKP